MEGKALLELVIVSFVLAIIAYLSIEGYRTEADPSVGQLALGIILTAFLGWYNMFRLLRRDKRIEVEEKKLETMKEQLAQDKKRTEMIEEQLAIEKARRKEEEARRPF